jgi:hypothetical protein
MPPYEPTYRPATHSDALCLSVLATQVFLDTYATQGIRPAIAREVRQYLSEEAFAEILSHPRCAILLAKIEDHLVGFAQLTHDQTHERFPRESPPPPSSTASTSNVPSSGEASARSCSPGPRPWPARKAQSASGSLPGPAMRLRYASMRLGAIRMWAPPSIPSRGIATRPDCS